MAAARAADKDPWRDALRAGRGTKGPEALDALRKLEADEAALAGQPAEGLRLLALRLGAAGDRDAAAAVLRRAWRKRPDDFWVNYDLARAPGPESGVTYEEDYPRPEEAVRHLTAALAVRPRSAMAHSSLGHALQVQGQKEEALAEHREAIRLEPGFAGAHDNLGSALYFQGKVAEAGAEYREAIRLRPDLAEAHANLANTLRGKPGEAIAEYREAIRLKPHLAAAHYNLGNTLFYQGKVDEAVAELRESIRFRPDFALAHNNLGNTLKAQGKVGEAIAEFREAIRLEPDLAAAHSSLGAALGDQGKLAEAIAAFREAIRLRPDFAEAHCGLGTLLQRQGHFPEALAEYRRGHELGSKRPNWSYPSAEWVRRAEHMVVLERRLPAVIRGQDRPRDAVEGLTLADMAYKTMRHGLSARLYAEALEADPKLGEDRRAQHRYNAACAAALAGCGQGQDDPPPDEPARAGLRRQALDWLGTELVAWGRVLDAGDPKARAAVALTLQHWKEDSDLAGIRTAASLARLPESERKLWRSLWAEVDRLLNASTAPARK